MNDGHNLTRVLTQWPSWHIAHMHVNAMHSVMSIEFCVQLQTSIAQPRSSRLPAVTPEISQPTASAIPHLPHHPPRQPSSILPNATINTPPEVAKSAQHPPHSTAGTTDAHKRRRGHATLRQRPPCDLRHRHGQPAYDLKLSHHHVIPHCHLLHQLRAVWAFGFSATCHKTRHG